MNAYLIAAKANAWELNQHVGRALEANQPGHKIEALGRGEGFFHEDRAKMLRSHRLFGGLFNAN